MRTSDWLFSLEAVPPFFCFHQRYAIVPLILEPQEGTLIPTTELPVNVKIHSQLMCPECPFFLQVFVKQSKTREMAVALLKIILLPRSDES
jgi:hypothetical protein